MVPIDEQAVMEAITNGEPCPSCDADWSAPLDEAGNPIPDAGNLVLVHGDNCVTKKGQ